jgi:hypothetical protein
MLHGDFSNKPAAIYAYDYRILVEVKQPMAWIVKAIPDLLLSGSFQRLMKEFFPLKEHVVMWLENTWDLRKVVFSIGLHDSIASVLSTILCEYVPEVQHFRDIGSFKYWLRHCKSLRLVYTDDQELLGIDASVVGHGGWTVRGTE